MPGSYCYQLYPNLKKSCIIWEDMEFTVPEIPILSPEGFAAQPLALRDHDLLRQLAGERLTTAEILYALPDHPLLLQTYIWQDYDHVPQFPVLQRFIAFWRRDLEGQLRRVTVSLKEAMSEARFTFYNEEVCLEN